MAIIKAIKMYQIKKLKLGMDGRGVYLSLVCPAAEAYCLCFTQGALVQQKDLDLSEDELNALWTGGTIDRGRYRLQGVPAKRFHANPSFRDFKSVPPEQIQIWSLSHKQVTNETVLHFPDDLESQLAFIPLRYHYTVSRENGFTYLKVELLDSGVYNDGVLMYQVGNALPIPIPAAVFGKMIRLRIPSNENVKVIVRSDYSGQYIPA